MFRMIGLAAVVAAAGLGGCATRPEVTIDTPISAADLAPYKRSGAATVVGRGSLGRAGARAVTCRGQQVLLTPAIAYNRQMVAAMRNGQKVVAGPHVGSSQSVWRKATCDTQGRFRFHNVPPGAWFVSIPIHWDEEPRDGALIKEIRVPAAGTVVVQLTERDVVR